jgi:glycosyltransferase involved in cell wall biosynthesis
VRALADADIVVEKLLGGDAGVISLEAMALGKVAVARIRDEVRTAHPEMPVVSADPGTIGDVIAKLVASSKLRAEIGERGKVYGEREHSGDAAAARIEEIYDSAKPSSARPHPDWAADPSERRLEAAFARIGRLEEQNARLRARR